MRILGYGEAGRGGYQLDKAASQVHVAARRLKGDGMRANKTGQVPVQAGRRDDDDDDGRPAERQTRRSDS